MKQQIRVQWHRLETERHRYLARAGGHARCMALGATHFAEQSVAPLGLFRQQATEILSPPALPSVKPHTTNSCSGRGAASRGNPVIAFPNELHVVLVTS